VHIIITDARGARTRALHLSGARLGLLCLGLALGLLLASAALYHWVFQKGAREGWPGVGALVRLASRDELEQRDRFLRDNLDAMARRLGDLQARLLQIEALGERVSGLAGMDPAELRARPGQGGALVDGPPLSLEALQATLAALERNAGRDADLMAVAESRLFDQKMKSLMVPTRTPLDGGVPGSPFGWRIDPFTGRMALHTGVDFQAEPGTPILAAAGGVVVALGWHPEYGNRVEVDHGNGLVTRYAHALRLAVHLGDLVRRGQQLATVGSTGRSTGPHLHFELLVQGVPQDPQKFLEAGRTPPPAPLALAAQRSRGQR